MHAFVINHTRFEQTYPQDYYPLLVGAVNRSPDMKEGVMTDDSGEQMSAFNDSYCELTGLYWMWKNCQDPVIGLLHYRRFFLEIRKKIAFRDDIYLKDPGDVSNCHLMTAAEAEAHLKKADLIVKLSHTYHWNMRAKLLDCIAPQVLKDLEAALMETDPAEYERFEQYLKRHRQILFNMFIGKKAVIDRYCEWLFPILQKADEKEIARSGERYHHREIGYLGEILFTYWIEDRKIPFYAADTLMPRKSPISVVAGIRMKDGTNIYPSKALFPNIWKWLSRK